MNTDNHLVEIANNFEHHERPASENDNRRRTFAVNQSRVGMYLSSCLSADKDIRSLGNVYKFISDGQVKVNELVCKDPDYLVKYLDKITVF